MISKKLLFRLIKLNATIRFYPTDYCNFNLSIRTEDYVMSQFLPLADINDYGMEVIEYMINDMLDKLEAKIDYEEKTKGLDDWRNTHNM